MKNKFEVRGEITVIFIERKNGDKFEVLIDTEDLSKIQYTSWNISKVNSRKSYIKATVGKERPYLHRVIMDAPKGFVVDHLSGDTLDNRKSNLKVVTQSENLQNRHKANANNKTGYKGVSYQKAKGTYRATARVGGKCKYIGSFKTPEEAGAAAAAYRGIHYQNSPERREATC